MDRRWLLHAGRPRWRRAVVTVAVFLGPTMPKPAAQAILPHATWLPPAAQGDLFRVARDQRPGTIALIDGAFLDVPAVWHREILWALRQGVKVLGAASMGALRAAELAPFGMVGVGRVFAAYRSGRYPPFEDPFEDDDEVAVIHAPADAGGLPLSDAMVDLRETLAAAAAAGAIEPAERDFLVAALKRLHFPERSVARLAALAADALGQDRAANFADWLAANPISQKRRDAEALLHLIAAGQAERLDPAPAFHMERALVWERFAHAHHHAPPSRAERSVLDELALDPPARRNLARIAVGRSAALATSAEVVDGAASLDAFRREHRLLSRAALDSWLKTNDLNAAGFLALLRREARLDSARARVEGPELDRMLLDLLRLEGKYAPLRDRAERKRASVGAVPPPGEVSRHLALDGFLSIHADLPSGPLDALAGELGFADKKSLLDAVWMEYLYAQHVAAGNA